MAGVEVRQVRKSYESVTVLHGIDINIPDGAFVVLVGPSGCGKSTLLRIIAGLEEVTGGAILIGGRDVSDMLPKDRDIAMVFQNYGLYPHMTVAQNMGFALKLAGVPKSEIAGRVDAAAKILNLTPLLDRYPRQLSGGQRQRVAMGRAIVRDPQVFLFDEPLSNLDAKLRVQMRAEIKQLHARLKVTTVYVTHDQIEAMTMADVIVVLQDGHVRQIGAPLDLYDRPENLFVAGFIGSPAMNLLPAKVDGGSLRLDDGQVLQTDLPGGLSQGQALTLGMRPEHLDLQEDGLALRVEVVEPTGAELHVGATLGGHPFTAVFRDRHAFRPGDTIRVAPQAGRLHLFDPASTARIG